MLTNAQLLNVAPSIGAVMPISTVSEKYSFIPTIKIVDHFREVGWFPVFADETRVRKKSKEGFQKHIVRFSQYGYEQMKNQERVDLCLYNSHDTGCAFQISASVWRKACSNGLMVSSDMFNFTHRHVGLNVEALVNSALTIAERSSEISQRIDEFKSMELLQIEREAFATVAHGLLFKDPNTAPIKPEYLLKEKRFDDKGKDLWTTFNVVQENMIRGGVRTNPKYRADAAQNGKTAMRKTRPIKALDKNLKLNKALWALTEKMYAFKLEKFASKG